MASEMVQYTIRSVGINKGRVGHSDLINDFTGEATLYDLMSHMKTALINVAMDTLREEQSKGFDPMPTVKVDNKFNKSVQNVEPFGKIEYIARNSIKNILFDTFDAINKRSPVVTGEFKSHNVVTFNGIQVATTRAELEAWLVRREKESKSFQAKDVFRFINTAPYARKLERFGVTRQRTKMKQETNKQATKKGRGRTFGRSAVMIPNGTYALASREISRKYKNNSFIKFRLVPGNNIGITGSDSSWKTGRQHRRNYKKDGRPYLYPTILIVAVAAGLVDTGVNVQ